MASTLGRFSVDKDTVGRKLLLSLRKDSGLTNMRIGKRYLLSKAC